MRFLISTILFCFIAGTVTAQENREEKAKILAVKAVKTADAGKYDEAIEILRKATQLDPGNITYPYELAYTFYLKKEYDAAIKILKDLTDHEDVFDLCYQLLGNCYDIKGKSKKAIKIYEEGLEKSPNSGKLFYEIGVVKAIDQKFNEAMNYWEKGIAAEPGFPSNYFMAAKTYALTSNKVWTVLYGELFLNLEMDTKRSKDICDLLFKTYKEAVTFTSDSSVKVKFNKHTGASIQPGKALDQLKIPFEALFETQMIKGYPGDSAKELSLNTFISLRKGFIEQWYNNQNEKQYPNILFDFHRQLIENDHFEAYNYWLLSSCKKEAIQTWILETGDQFDSFFEWSKQNKLAPDKKHFLSRIQYN